MSTLKRLFASGSIQSRLLVIALVPSIAALLVGVGLSGYLVYQGLSVHSFVSKLADAKEPSARFLSDVQDERQLTLVYLSGRSDRAALDDARADTDRSVDEMRTVVDEFASAVPDEAREEFDEFRTQMGALREVRQQVDTGPAELDPVYNFYNELIDAYNMSFRTYIRYAPDAQVSYESGVSSDLLDAADAMARGHALALGRTSVGMTPTQYHEYAHQIGAFHDNLNSLTPRMTPQEQQEYEALQKRSAWKRVDAVQDAMEVAGGKAAAGEVITVPVSTDDWISASHDLAQELNALSTSHYGYAVSLGETVAAETMGASAITGSIIVLIAIVVFLVALRLSQLVVRRLTRLRRETLALAEREMPSVVARLRDGKQVDIEHEVSWLDFGRDEIGQVARAFNKAQMAAISATVQEAETRQGVRSVFLNIAHRSQVMVHRQLQVLDKAERKLEDPDQLELLFQLDHLATQSRRNAENLIILGGQRPGRQWRNPVPLHDVVQGAVAETELYARVDIGSVPDVSVQGRAVADLVHLLAELVDNATSFSPPESHVEVRGNVVGKGVIVEVEDQGIGLEQDKLDELNRMLVDPPDFSVMALSEEARMGLFVVARLASRHELRVTLRESAYGGVRAVVMIPNYVVAERGPQTDRSDRDADTGQLPAVPGETERLSVPRKRQLTGRLDPDESPDPIGPDSPITPHNPVGQMPDLPAKPRGQQPSVPQPRPAQPNQQPQQQRSAQGPRPPQQVPGLSTQLPNVPAEDRPKKSTSGAPPEPDWNGTPKKAGAVASDGLAPAGSVEKPPLPQRKRGQKANLAAPLRAQLDQGGNAETTGKPAAESGPPSTPDRFRNNMTAFQSGTKRARSDDTGRTARPGGNEA
ncbi:nitrate- and nitrite sensing domain-containing protein [Saccharopolyspora griseoalba]|uniref:histidine kinase n=1 Tax=Saccharopolyspora griseoalba TaxID=1431848 RepID=A0ABW2LKA1_9PSEU